MDVGQDVSFVHKYLSYNSHTEAPKLFHRWTAYSAIAALLGHNFYLQHGHFEIYPNMYVMFMGSPGTRKSTSIKVMSRLLKDIGYDKIAANRTTKEKFLLDLYEGVNNETISGLDSEGGIDSFLDKDFREPARGNQGPSEVFVMADEFNVFIGRGNLEFIDILGDLWDYTGAYRGRVKNSQSVLINDPCVNILAANTPSGFAKAFPPEVIEQGFLSRMILVHGKPTGVKIPFPRTPPEEESFAIKEHLMRIWKGVIGRAEISKEAMAALTEIYRVGTPMEDSRFEYYVTRRFTHLLKLCLISAAARLSKTVEIGDVIESNTILTFTEGLMPQALGEFGKSKMSDVTNKVMDALNAAKAPMELGDIWKVVAADLEKMPDLANILQNLEKAAKIQRAVGPSGKTGFLPKKKSIMTENVPYVDYSLLTDEEKLNV